MLSKYSKTHEVFFGNKMNELTGNINSQYNNFYSFFSLKEVNRQLQLENTLLKNNLAQPKLITDSNLVVRTDTTLKDSTGKFRKYTYIPALVVGNNVSAQNNYITIEKGLKDGVQKGMGVVGPIGVVGEVVAVSEHYSIVMSVLNRNSRISSMVKKDNNAGSVEWDGKDPSFLILKNIPKSSKVIKGDTVVTSTYSSKFPSHIMVGIVADIYSEQASNSFTLKLKTATNFYALQQVYIIKNARFAEQTTLEASIPQKNND